MVNAGSVWLIVINVTFLKNIIVSHILTYLNKKPALEAEGLPQ